MPEVNLACPHKYQAMVMACLNGKIGEHEYKMLIDSGSELNIMTLNQAQELALPIDDSGNSWTLKGISGHMMGLEGICWNILVRIGGIEFLHNFFVTRMDLGNKDMVLGQPWLFSHLMRIDYVHDMGVTLQLWEDRDRKGHSILINPRNVMPVSLCQICETCSVEVMKALTPLANPGDDLKARKTPEFMGHAVEALEMIEANSKKPRPLGINEDLLLESSLSSPFFAEAIKKAWFVHVKDDMGMLVEQIVKLKEKVGISPFMSPIMWYEEMKE